jgi:hypothetical protein
MSIGIGLTPCLPSLAGRPPRAEQAAEVGPHGRLHLAHGALDLLLQVGQAFVGRLEAAALGDRPRATQQGAGIVKPPEDILGQFRRRGMGAGDGDGGLLARYDA